MSTTMRWGEGHFVKKLVDFDLASGNDGWQLGGSGYDAVPYFRIFNPHLQLKKVGPN